MARMGSLKDQCRCCLSWHMPADMHDDGDGPLCVWCQPCSDCGSHDCQGEGECLTPAPQEKDQ